MDARRLVTGAAEIRAAEDGGRRLFGTAIQEGRAAGDRGEVFAPGAIAWPAEGMGVATAHRAAPEVRATTTRQRNGEITIEARATPRIVEAYEAGRRALSIEFHSLAEERKGGNVREITSAFVPLVAMVPVGAYNEASAELRRRLGPSLTSSVPTGKAMSCKCPGGGCEQILFEVDAFDLLEEALATTGSMDRTIGTATLTPGRAGLGIGINLIDTEAARDTASLIESGIPVFARPLLDLEESQTDETRAEGGTLVVKRASFSTILVKPVAGGVAGMDPVRVHREGRQAVPWSRRRLLL